MASAVTQTASGMFARLKRLVMQKAIFKGFR
jgi:hypothetical protein